MGPTYYHQGLHPVRTTCLSWIYPGCTLQNPTSRRHGNVRRCPVLMISSSDGLVNHPEVIDLLQDKCIGIYDYIVLTLMCPAGLTATGSNLIIPNILQRYWFPSPTRKPFHFPPRKRQIVQMKFSLASRNTSDLGKTFFIAMSSGGCRIQMD